MYAIDNIRRKNHERPAIDNPFKLVRFPDSPICRLNISASSWDIARPQGQCRTYSDSAALLFLGGYARAHLPYMEKCATMRPCGTVHPCADYWRLP
jgi:hypothetical protein